MHISHGDNRSWHLRLIDRVLWRRATEKTLAICGICGAKFDGTLKRSKAPNCQHLCVECVREH